MFPIRYVLGFLLILVFIGREAAGQFPGLRSTNELYKPSARFGVYFDAGADVDSVSDDFDNLEYTADTGLFRKETDPWFYTLGVRYRLNQIDFKAFDFLDNRTLHRLDVPLTVRYRPPNSPWRFWSLLRPGLASDFEQIDEDDLTLSFLIAGAYAFRDKFQLTFGGYVSQDLGGQELRPSLGFIWDPNPAWRLNVTPPNITLSHQPGEDWILKLSAWPGGGSWNVASDEGDRNVAFQSVHAAFGVEYRLVGPVWLSVWGGVNVFQTLEIDDERERELFDEDLDPSGFVYAGLRITAW